MKRIISLVLAAMLMGLPLAAQTTTNADKRATVGELKERQLAQRKACQVDRTEANCVNLKKHQKQERKQLAKRLGVRPKHRARRY